VPKKTPLRPLIQNPGESENEPIPRHDLAAYVADMAAELSLMTGRARWPLLTYFLNMARVEAESQMRLMAESGGPPPGGNGVATPSTPRRLRRA
jgi:hypothetical protein